GDPPKRALVVLDLPRFQVTRIEGVRSWSLPEESGAFVAYSRATQTDPGTPNPMTPTGPRPGTRPGSRPATPQRTYGSELVLRNLADKSERTINDVLEHSF